MKLVIDTSIIIDYLRNGQRSIRFFEENTNEDTYFIPTVVLYELFSGKSSESPSVQAEIKRFIRDFQRVELSEEIAIKAGMLYRDIGKSIGVQDYIIAASALEIGATVVTLNTKHFSQIPHLHLYEF